MALTFKRQIVGKDSAFVAGTKNVPLIGLHKDHINMVKFASEDDEDYKTVSSHLLLMSRDAPTRIARAWKRKRTSSPAVPSRATTTNSSASGSTETPVTLVGQYRLQSVQTSGVATVHNSRSRTSSTSSLGLRGGESVSQIHATFTDPSYKVRSGRSVFWFLVWVLFQDI